MHRPAPPLPARPVLSNVPARPQRPSDRAAAGVTRFKRAVSQIWQGASHSTFHFAMSGGPMPSGKESSLGKSAVLALSPFLEANGQRNVERSGNGI